MLQIRVIQSVSELEELVPRWRKLMERAVHAQPVLTPLWLLAWWREFGDRDGRALRTVAFLLDDDLVGLVPLARRATVRGWEGPVRRLELLGTGENEADEICSEYVGALVARGSEALVADATARTLLDGVLGGWDELRLTAMSGDDPFVPTLAASLGRCGIPASVKQSGECPYVPLPQTWDDYLRALGASRRYVVTRSLRELDRWAGQGNWTLHRARTAGELVEGRRVLRDLHEERWGADGRSGVFASARFTRFHDAIMPRLLAGEDGTGLDLMWLVARGDPIAAAYDIVFRNKVYFYQSGRRVDLPKGLRPGIAIHALSIRAAIEAGRCEYDLLGGATRYKRDIACATRSLVTLRAVAPHWRARAIEAARSLSRLAASRVRRARMPAVPPGDGRLPD